MKKKYSIMTFCVLFEIILFTACDNKNPIQKRFDAPVISSLASPDTIYSDSNIKYNVSVKVFDPQGLNDIKIVKLLMFSEISSIPTLMDTLKDDGTDGDLSSQDGIFSNTLNFNFTQLNDGKYILKIIAIDLSDHVSDTLYHSITLISVMPILSHLLIPDAIYLETDIHTPISVEVTDPQGLEDIRTVKYFIFNLTGSIPLSEGTLNDDGIDGDLTADDGTFAGSFNIDFAEETDRYFNIGVVAKDKSDHLSDTLFKIIKIIPVKPILFNLSVNQILYILDNKKYSISVNVSDPQGWKDIKKVQYGFYAGESHFPIWEDILMDEENMGQIYEPDDMVCSKSFNLDFAYNRAGLYKLAVAAEDQESHTSDSLFADILIVDEQTNKPPVLFNPVFPDTVSRSSANSLLITIQANDPQGLSDIISVKFDSVKPDGTPSAGNPFIMYDDGLHGDVKSGDGIYSLLIAISPNNDKGIYQFKYFANDYLGLTSDMLVIEIVVID